MLTAHECSERRKWEMVCLHCYTVHIWREEHFITLNRQTFELCITLLSYAIAELTRKHSYIFKLTLRFKVVQSPANTVLAHSFENFGLVWFLPFPDLLSNTVVWFLLSFCLFVCLFTWTDKFIESWSAILRMRFFKIDHSSSLAPPPQLPHLFLLKYSYFIKKFCCLCAMI